MYAAVDVYHDHLEQCMTIEALAVILTNEVLSWAGWPGGASLSEGVRRVTEKRLTAAREIWLSELRRGIRDLAQVGAEDEIAAILFRYQRAAVEGTARVNLRLLAAVAAGQTRDKGFAADEFLTWCDALASLRAEELIVLGALHRHEHANGQPTEQVRSEQAQKIWHALREELVPKLFPTPAHLDTAITASVRSGLVRMVNFSMDGSIQFGGTPLLDKLVELAPIEETLGREGYRVQSK